MALKAPTKSCSSCPAASNPNIQGNCATLLEVQNANTLGTNVNKPDCLARIQSVVGQFSGQVVKAAKI